MKWTPSIGITKGQAIRMTKPEYGVIPKMGRSWWFWLPYLKWNKGIPYYHAYSEISISWLCYWFGIYFQRNYKQDNTAVSNVRKGDV